MTALLLIGLLTFPSLSVSMGMVESGMNPYAVGDGGRSHGMFQVQPRHWGRVPKSALGQMAKHDAVLVRLWKDSGDLSVAVRQYNGAGRKAKAYLRKVRRGAMELELLGVGV